MDILYIHTLDLSYTETSETFVVYNVLSLCNYADSVEIVLINRKRENPEKIIKEKFNLSELPKNLKITDFHLKQRSKIAFYWFVRKYLNKLPETTLVVTRAHGVLKWIFKWNTPKQKVVFETHDYFFDLSKRVDIGRYGRKKKSRIERKYFKYLDAIIGSNDYQAELYSEHFPEKPVQSFPTGLIKIHEAKKKRANKVAYIGTLEPRLGMDRVMSLIKYLPNNIEVVIIGGRGEKDVNEFISLFPDSILPENVKVTGWLKKKELFEVLKDIKLGLLPLYTDQNRFALPLKIFDYFAFGIPVFSSPLPAIEKIIIEGETGFYVDWEKPEELAHQIKDLFSDQQKWDELSSYVYQKAGDLTWDRRAKDQIEFFEKLT